VGEVVDKRVDDVDARGVDVKAFFQDSGPGVVEAHAPIPRTAGTLTVRPAPTGARIAIYDSLAAAPRVEEIAAQDLSDAIEQVASRTYNLARESGGQVPYTIIREVSENLIHAGFSEVVVTILDGGNTVRFADQGPGIADKDRVFLPGFSTATAEMKRHIRGVGSGLPIVRECLSFAGGTVEVDDNLGRGTVVTLCVRPAQKAEHVPEVPVPRLSQRQKQVLSLVMELGSAGPSAVARELSVALSTAYLEEAGLIVADESGKRALAERGITLLDSLLR
jgi:anti-sigma regulatory factor (Ser/Thr protein kinase)